MNRPRPNHPSPPIRWVTEFTGQHGVVTQQKTGRGESCFLLNSGDIPGAEETHAALVLSADPMNRRRMVVTMRTHAQLRPDPNPWECGWLVFSAAGPREFCYLIPKPNGIEVGWTDHDKQGFLVTLPAPVYPIGEPIRVEMEWTPDDIVFRLPGEWDCLTGKPGDGFRVACSNPMWQGHSPSGGRIGFYCEDSVASFTLEEVRNV